jgi:DNA-binding MarR family transcriptional regulator
MSHNKYLPRIGRPPIDARLRSFVRHVYRERLATQKQLAKFLGYSQSTIHRTISE